MTTPNKLAANRRNALLSTGPRTAEGKAASAANSAVHGVRSRQQVIEWLGETEAAYAAHRAAVVASLAPATYVEEELAEWVAELLWRRRRAGRLDLATAAVALQPVVELDSDGGVHHPADPLPGLRADAEHGAGVAAASAAAHRLAAEVVAGDAADGVPLDPAVCKAAVSSLCYVAGSTDPDRPGQVVRHLAVAGAVPPGKPDRPYDGWTVAAVRAVAGHLAATTGRDVAGLLAAAGADLAAEADELEELSAGRRRDADRYAGQAAGRRVGDALGRASRGLVALDVAARYERHLSAELARSLKLLDQVRGGRPADGVVVVVGDARPAGRSVGSCGERDCLESPRMSRGGLGGPGFRIEE